jgi:hypothetical protein
MNSSQTNGIPQSHAQMICEVPFSKVTAWPVECAECFGQSETPRILHSLAEAVQHCLETGHEHAGVPESAESARRRELMTERKYSICVTCGGMKIESRAEADQHMKHMVLDYYDVRASLRYVN